VNFLQEMRRHVIVESREFSPHALAVAGVTAVLNYVDLSVITNAQCATVFGSYVISSTLCVSTLDGHSTCNVSVYKAWNPYFFVPFIKCLCLKEICFLFHGTLLDKVKN
jgi:hypothetical protein